MSRNSHTISKFKGVNYLDSVVNIAYPEAIDALNLYGDTGGWLTQFQQPSILLDWADPANAASNRAASLSMGSLPTPNAHPRLIFQQGNEVLYADTPYSVAALLDHPVLAGIAARLDYALCNSILYLSNGQDGGYVRPGSNSRYKWGIAPPPAPTLITASTTRLTGATQIQRTAGVVTVVFSAAHGASVGQPLYIDPNQLWGPSFGGVYRIDSVPGPTRATYLQPGLPDTGIFLSVPYTGGITATTGWQYGACYGASPVKHWSSLSDLSESTGPVTNQSPVVPVAPSDDWQVDQVALFRNQDSVVPGGGLWYLEYIQPTILTGDFAGYGVFVDNLSDEDLATSGQTAPYDNGVSPNGKYLAVWLDRVLMCGIKDDPSGVRFTGYETINFGRPQMSWCQFNEIKLGQGQAQPLGMGLLRYGGMVFFADNGLMYVYKGTLNDISVSAPTSLSFYAEQLPYNIGCYSHFTIQPTPAGLVWLDDGFNLRVMDNTGFYPPKDLAPNLSGLFKRITPGSRDVVASVHINYLQNDWYILSLPIDGSFTNNVTVVIDVTAEASRNTGAWPVQHSITGMVWAGYPDQTYHLLALMPQLTTSGPASPPAKAGYLTRVPLRSPMNSGLADPGAIALHPPNPPMPGAFWRGGYWGLRDEQGADEYSEMKMFRYIRLNGTISDGFRVQAYLVNGDEWTWDTPAVIDFMMDGDLGGLNQKSRAMSPLIIFPDSILATVQSMMVAWNITATR